ncbi:MAG: B12-binding domain-containing radical SAM protein [Candidatus Brocadiaceae bacterium]|nr:B12-binding domain-containing radical SAM protein [Candidatus Brocadiaceae bacterium]
MQPEKIKKKDLGIIPDQRVALINVVIDGDYQYPQEIPLGMGAVGAFLREKGVKVEFIQCFASKGKEELVKAANIESDLYGFQLNISNFRAIEEVVALLKKRKPTALTVLGGPFLIEICEDVMLNQPLFDFIVLGEGEETTLDLLRQLDKKDPDYGTLPSLIWRNEAGLPVRNSARRKTIKNLDDLPFPARDFFEKAQRDPIDGGLMESVRVITSRGCVSKCTFCLVNQQNVVNIGKMWRGWSYKKVVDELEYLQKEFGAWSFNFSDSSFDDPGTLGKERSMKICQEIINRKLKTSSKIYLRCDNNTRLEDRSRLELYKKAGIDVIIIGAESGSDLELELYGKKARLVDNINTVKNIRSLDLFYCIAGFIMFGPNSTLSTIKENIDFMKKFDFCDDLDMLSNILILFKSTQLYKQLEADGRIIPNPNYWSQPKYVFKDKKAETLARHWANVISKYPLASQVNHNRANLGNLIARITNPMNSKVYETLYDDWVALKKSWDDISLEMNEVHYDYFIKSLTMVDEGAPWVALDRIRDEMFMETYINFNNRYLTYYNDFLNKVNNKKLPMTGLVFKHFTAAVFTDDGLLERT